ncbi:MAG: hypothetical protein OXE92_07015 [Bacteroidetes bacterium]|nr:hypothetical protein [Bacteroidota bacterium]MCY4205456.1 hypothetical protein [Bacteroidota bacterium]
MNETLLYILLGVLYLIFTALGRVAKKRQQTTNKKEPWSLEDALGDLQGPFEERPDVAPAPLPRDLPDPYMPPNINAENSLPDLIQSEYTPSVTPIPQQPPALPSKPTEATESLPSTPSTPAKIAEKLKNQKSAQIAIVLGEILGRPKGARGIPRRYR